MLAGAFGAGFALGLTRRRARAPAEPPRRASLPPWLWRLVLPLAVRAFPALRALLGR